MELRNQIRKLRQEHKNKLKVRKYNLCISMDIDNGSDGWISDVPERRRPKRISVPGHFDRNSQMTRQGQESKERGGGDLWQCLYHHV